MKSTEKPCNSPLDPSCMSSLKHWGEPLRTEQHTSMQKNSTVNCGWGRLLFGQTFDDPKTLARSIVREQRGKRDIAMYVRDPHVVTSYAPQELFIDPSLTYRLDFDDYQETSYGAPCLQIHQVRTVEELHAVNRIYLSRNMVPCDDDFVGSGENGKAVTLLYAREARTDTIVGAITGVDHFLAFRDPDNGSSLWALAVDQQSLVPKVGEFLVRELILRFMEAGRRFIDLSVMHSNNEAIGLYKKLSFKQVPVYCIKKKNSINEPLYVGSRPTQELNVYGTIITDEARRRGISVEVLDAANGYFQLTLGGRAITCRESLSELTSAIAMSRCDDKSITRSLLLHAGLKVPAQIVADEREAVSRFLDTHGRVVVKPAQGEQGEGVRVDIDDPEEVFAAMAEAGSSGAKVLVEEMAQGMDLRIIVINDEVVAGAVRKPATIIGNGELSIRQLIEKQSRRRAAATRGESSIPLDGETVRTISKSGYCLDDVLPAGVELAVRKTANLHTGGTIHDVTDELSATLRETAITAARALNIPVVGLDYILPDFSGEEYVIIEANERPGLANHEPQPTAERFIDLLFPQTKNAAGGLEQ